MYDKRIEKYTWIPLLCLLFGGAIPYLFVDISEYSFDYKIQGLIFPSMLFFALKISESTGKKYSKLGYWVGNTLSGASLFLFLFGLGLITASVSFSILPIPNWLHIGLGLCISAAALFLFFSNSVESS